MATRRRVRTIIVVGITTIVSAVVCFFCFERVEQVIFFTILLDLFLLALISIFYGSHLSIKLTKELLRQIEKNKQEKE